MLKNTKTNLKRRLSKICWYSASPFIFILTVPSLYLKLLSDISASLDDAYYCPENAQERIDAFNDKMKEADSFIIIQRDPFIQELLNSYKFRYEQGTMINNEFSNTFKDGILITDYLKVYKKLK